MKIRNGKLRMSIRERLAWWWMMLKWRVTGRDPGTPIEYPFEDDGKTYKS